MTDGLECDLGRSLGLTVVESEVLCLCSHLKRVEQFTAYAA